MYHMTSYALAAGIPLALVLGGPVATGVDLALGVLIPVHAHIGMRSVLIDYVHDATSQRVALAALAAFTVLTAVGLTKFNLLDVGITGGVKELFVEQTAPPSAAAAAAAAHHGAKHSAKHSEKKLH